MDCFEGVLNNLPDAICVIDTNTNKVKYVNDTFSDQLLSRKMIIGQTFEFQILQDTSRVAFSDALLKAKTSSIDVTIGLCKSLSTVGNEKCKYFVDVIFYKFYY